MEIVKLNEIYNVTDKTESGWSLNGSLQLEVNGSLSLHCNVNSELEEFIGSFSYYKPVEENINVSVNVNEENRDNFTKYANSIIESVLTNFA